MFDRDAQSRFFAKNDSIAVGQKPDNRQEPIAVPLQVQTSLFATEKRGRKRIVCVWQSSKRRTTEGFFACQGTFDRRDGCFKAIDEMEGEAFIFAPENTIN